MPIELTPMIDVVFLLIIFFMTTAQFARMTRAEVDLPREPGERQRAPEEAGIVINILKDGSIIVGDKIVGVDQMIELVRENMTGSSGGPGAKVLVRADREADSVFLNQVMSRLRRAGVGNARIATEVP
ncbi:MAG TPA: biopolymer transporter ExbD [Phycisphaerales bacterium]|nr:biopolymer transporter ExbD [Phycisphaerales bacterium]HRQ74299.1 biopolymer transporter ExbD [Phycisphaerales bacterium]